MLAKAKLHTEVNYAKDARLGTAVLQSSLADDVSICYSFTTDWIHILLPVDAISTVGMVTHRPEPFE